MNRKSEFKTFYKCVIKDCLVNAVVDSDDPVAICNITHIHDSSIAEIIINRMNSIFLEIIAQDPYKSGLSIYQQARKKFFDEHIWSEFIF